MKIPYCQVKRIATLIQQQCNLDGDSIVVIQARVWETMRKGTYRLRYNTQEEIVGYADYDLTPDGIVHVRKIVALQPGVLLSMVSELKRTLPWKRVMLYRAKYKEWRHHGRPWRMRNAMV